MVTDPIADFITRIRNGYLAHKQSVTDYHSKQKEKLAEILVREGYLNKFSITPVKDKSAYKTLTVKLKYSKEKPAMESIKRVSKPGRKIYVGKDKIPSILSGYGTAIISTSNGLMSDAEARKQGIGGEVICYIS